MIGIVTWFNVSKGYGEIYSETGEVFFFTYLDLPKIQKFRTIARGEVVEFSVSDEKYFDQRLAKKIKQPTKSKRTQDIIANLKGAIA